MRLLTSYSYEGDWEPIAVRGTSFSSFAPVKPLAIPPNPAHNYIVPKGRSFEEAEEVTREQKQKSRKSSAIILPRDYRKTLQAFKPAVGSGKHSAQDSRAAQPRENVQTKVTRLPAFQVYRASPESPDEVFHFNRSIKTILNALPKQQNVEPSEVLRDRLAAICIDTNTYISIASNSADACNIWGEPNHVIRAKESLLAFEMNAANPSQNNTSKPNPAWNKVGAFDGREHDRTIRARWLALQQQFLQQGLDDSNMPYQTHLYWPEGYDVDNFIGDYGEDILHDLMIKYNCVIRQQAAERVTKIGCDTQQVLFQVHNRLMGLMREMVARKKPGMYAIHCEAPGSITYRDRVKLTKVMKGGEPINIPSLTGQPLPRSEHEQWAQLSSDINRKYKRTTRLALQSCINALYLSRKHLQLRVIFGDLGLIQVMKAENGQTTYHIDDFLTKIQLPGTKVLQRPLQEGVSFGFTDNIESFQEFEPLDISWEVSFDFSGGPNNPHKTLQLLKEFSHNMVDPDEPSVAATRWLTYSDASIDDKTDLISINHIDLERVGYQLYLGGGTLFQNQKTLQDLRSFETNIKFRPSLNGLRYDSIKHVTHPYGNQELTTMRETSISKYRFKDTRGTFEIRRTDQFNCKPGESSPDSQRTEWSAAYYYAGWDNLLSAFANIDPGQDVEWKRDLATFFPKVEDSNNPQILPKGFKNFMKEVDEIQTLISRAIGRGKEASTNGFTNGEQHKN